MPTHNGGSRSFHKKSRNSCAICKKRRVKCSLQLPTCANCHRRNEVCIYPSFENGPFRQGRSPRSSETQFASLSHSLRQTPLSMIYTANTSATRSLYKLACDITKSSDRLNVGMTDSASPGPLPPLLEQGFFRFWNSCELPLSKTRVWYDALASQMPTSAWLTHCVLAIHYLPTEASTLPLELKTPVPALQHLLRSSESFRAANPVIDAQNWQAILMFGICVLLFQFAMQQTCPEEDYNYMETISVLRSSANLAKSVAPFLKTSGLFTIIKERPLAPTKRYDLDCKLAIMELEIQLIKHEGLEKVREPIAQAITRLYDWLEDCQGVPGEWKDYIYWPAYVSSDYLRLLAAENDFALLVFIYWCTFLHRGRRRWFIKYWPFRAVRSALGKLKGDWNELLAWPKDSFEMPQWSSPATKPYSCLHSHSSCEDYQRKTCPSG